MAALLGLTGGLAAGKTVACEAFRGLDVYVCDADEVGRDLTAAGGAAVEAVLRAVGSGFVLRAVGDGFGSAAAGIDRAALRRAAFIDSSLREKLERVLHPLIFARMESELAANDGGAYKIACAPLLFETGMERRLRFDAGILAIDCIEATQLARAIGRGLETEDARRIMAAQMPRAARIAKATAVITNDKTRDDLESAVIDFDRKLRARLAALS